MKNFLVFVLSVLFILAGSISCSKIDDIDKRLNQVESNLTQLQAQVSAGAVITSINKVEGITTITLSNGQSYKIADGKDGINGKDGKDGKDGDSILADIQIEEDFIVLILASGESLKISYQNPLSLASLNIMPDYSDGSVGGITDDFSFNLSVAVTPGKYVEDLADTSRFVHKAVFLPVQTKGNQIPEGIYLTPSKVTGCDGYLAFRFSLDADIAETIRKKTYTVSLSIEGRDGIHGNATEFVPINSKNPDPAPVTTDVRFMVFSDLHYMNPDLLINDGSAIEKYISEDGKLLRESGDILNAAAERIKEEKPQFVIICGDMTKDGEVIGHQHVASLFKKLREEIGTKVLVVPGNHDINNPHSLYYDGSNTAPAESATEEQFAAIYADFGYGEAVERRAGSLDYMSYPVEGIAFIGVNSTEKNTAEIRTVQGGLSKEQTEWIKSMAQKAHSDGRYVIMAMHHNLVDFYDNAQLIRGANIANAKYDGYNNQALINDLCDAGIDVVFSGHSHMHSITSAKSNSHTIYSVVTSSLVTLPIAYRIGTIDRNGKMTLSSGDLKNCSIPGGVDLQTKGEKCWRDVSSFYIEEAADKAWNAASSILKSSLQFKSREDFLSFLKMNGEDIFYTFVSRTSEGNEHLFSPEENYLAAKEMLDNIMDFLNKKLFTITYGGLFKAIVGMSITDFYEQLCQLVHSAYFNYLGNDPVMPDDAIEIQLTTSGK